MSDTADNTARQAGYAVANAMLRPTPDAVAQARKKYTATLPELDFAYRQLGPSEIAAAEENTECAWAEVLAAVRAECAAKVEGWVLDRIAALGKQPDITKPDSARYAWAGKATAYDAMLAHVTGADIELVDESRAAQDHPGGGDA